MLADVEIRLVEGGEKAGIEVGRDDVSGGTDLLREPARDGASASADLQAVPPGSDAEGGEMAYGAGIEPGLQASQPLALLLPGIIEEIAGHLCSLSDGTYIAHVDQRSEGCETRQGMGRRGRQHYTSGDGTHGMARAFP